MSCRHHPALPYAEAPHFMADLSGRGGIAASMLHFLIFTACRTNEVVDARWSEIDRPSSTWKIPGERMKMHQDHVVPLSEPALAILDKMRDNSEGELIFPNPDDGAFSENAMLAVLDRLGYGHVTVHGFRSTFATWAEECTDHLMVSARQRSRTSTNQRLRQPISAGKSSRSDAFS